MNFNEIIEYIINSENEEDFEPKVFIEKYGIVTDKSLAIEIIILNPNTIKVLNQELQNDKEILIYFFPYRMTGRYLFNGYQIFSNFDSFNIDNVDRKYWEIHETVIFPDNPNFEFGIKKNHHDHDIKEVCLLPNQNGLLDEEFIKNYNQILRELIELSLYKLEKANNQFIIDTMFDILINRTKIKEIVNKYIHKGKSPITLKNNYNTKIG